MPESPNRVSSFVSRHKKTILASSVSVVLTATISIVIHLNIVGSLKVSYETEYTKKLTETLRTEKTITDRQISEIVNKVNTNSSVTNSVLNSQLNQRRIDDLTTIKYTFTDQDKTKITDYMLSYIRYYQDLQVDNDGRLNTIYNDKNFYTKYGYSGNESTNESLLKYYEAKREEYKTAIERMQQLLFDFYGIVQK